MLKVHSLSLTIRVYLHSDHSFYVVAVPPNLQNHTKFSQN